MKERERPTPSAARFVVKSHPRPTKRAYEQHPIVQLIDSQRVERRWNEKEFSERCLMNQNWYAEAIYNRSLHNAVLRIERVLKPLGFHLRVEPNTRGPNRGG